LLCVQECMKATEWCVLSPLSPVSFFSLFSVVTDVSGVISHFFSFSFFIHSFSRSLVTLITQVNCQHL
jgi:hypothetical protein